MPELGDMSEEVCRDLLRAPGFADKLGSVNLVLRLEQLVFDCSIGTCKVTRVLGSTKGHGSPPSNGRSKWLRFERKDSGVFLLNKLPSEQLELLILDSFSLNFPRKKLEGRVNFFSPKSEQ